MRVIVWLGVAGCGIGDDVLLVDLSEDDVAKLCEGVEPETFVCEPIEIAYDADGCADSLEVAEGCTATVGEWRTCDEASRAQLREDPCALETPPECEWTGGC